MVGTYRELANIQGWEQYMGLTVKAPGKTISKVVIGLAGRETANAAEPRGFRRAPSLAITARGLHAPEPSGVYSSGWGKIVDGVIVCKLDPTMAKDETFAISFQPPGVPAGTKFLVKLQATDGKRLAIVTTK